MLSDLIWHVGVYVIGCQWLYITVDQIRAFNNYDIQLGNMSSATKEKTWTDVWWKWDGEGVICLFEIDVDNNH